LRSGPQSHRNSSRKQSNRCRKDVPSCFLKEARNATTEKEVKMITWWTMFVRIFKQELSEWF
jgi:hypothetical protein